jgi:hypothetical protein
MPEKGQMQKDQCRHISAATTQSLQRASSGHRQAAESAVDPLPNGCARNVLCGVNKKNHALHRSSRLPVEDAQMP